MSTTDVAANTPGTAKRGELRRNLSLWGAVGVALGLMAPSLAINLNPQAPALHVGRSLRFLALEQLDRRSTIPNGAVHGAVDGLETLGEQLLEVAAHLQQRAPGEGHRLAHGVAQPDAGHGIRERHLQGGDADH